MRVATLLFGFFLGLALPVCAAPARPMPVETVVVDSASGPRTLKLEIAATPEAQERGLMFRKHLGRNSGMLFDFGQPLMCAFWMKNTYLPLDMLFVRADGRISTIAANAVPLSTKEIISAEPVRAVIEIGGGRAKALGLVPGDIVHAAAFRNAVAAGRPGTRPRR